MNFCLIILDLLKTFYFVKKVTLLVKIQTWISLTKRQIDSQLKFLGLFFSMYPVNFVINFHFGCSSSRKLRILETFPSNSQWVVKSAAWLVQVQKLGQRQQLRDKVVVRFSLPCNLHAGSRTCSKLSLFKPTELRSTISKQKSQHNPTLRFQEKNKSQVHNLNLSNFYNFRLKEKLELFQCVLKN